MPRVIAQHRSMFLVKDRYENKESVESVFSDESIPLFPSYDLYPKKMTKISISRSSAKLKSINLNDNKRKDEDDVPIRRKNAPIRQNPFLKYKVPDEVVDVIFHNLRKRDLVSAMQVCKQFYVVGHASKNWSTTDVMDRPITELTLATLMKRNIRVLRLAGAKPDMSIFIGSQMFDRCMVSSSRLEFLDLSRTNLSHRQISMLLKPCRKLQCLSIEGNILDDYVASYISQNKDLRQLDISMTHGITSQGARMIIMSCRNLEQLNAAWCGLTEQILDVFSNNMPDTIRKLNLSGSVRTNGLTDDHIEVLSARAMNLIDIDVSDNIQLGDATVATLISRFPKLFCASLNRCYGIDPNIVVHLNCKPSLIYLNVHGCITDSNMELFLSMCPRLKTNRHFFNFTAKPVANNAPYIWENDMREH